MPKAKPPPTVAVPRCCGRPCKRTERIRFVATVELEGREHLIEVDKTYFQCGGCKRRKEVDGVAP